MARHTLSILAVALLCNLDVAGMSLQLHVEENTHGTDLEQQSDEEDASISLMSRDIILSKPKTTTLSPAEKAKHERIARWEALITRAIVFWAIGLFLGLVGQSVVAIGYLIQKMAQMKSMEEEIEGSSPRSDVLSLVKRKSTDVLEGVGVGHTMSGVWWMGLIVFIVGHLFCWMALGFAPQSVIACLQSWNMVVVMLLGPRMVQEAVPKGACMYCSLIVIGCIIVVICGPQEIVSVSDNFESLEIDMYHWYWMGPAAAALLIMCLAHIAHVPPVYAFILLSAVCAWYASTLAKVTAVLTVADVLGSSGVYWALLVIFVIFFVLAIFQIHFMNMALRHGDATLVIPLYECLSMIGNIVFGAIFWHEFYGIGWIRFTGFIFGVAVIILGLGLLTKDKLATENLMVENSVGSLVADNALEDA